MTDAATLKSTRWLAWVDVLNSGAWLGVVFLLEVDVWLQLKRLFTGGIVMTNRVLKIALYTLLFLAAVYWGVYGQFLDFCDAVIWLVAFVFIEINLFEWASETKENLRNKA